jgi:imidazolonepropionase-like amidohydrolase
LIDGTGRPVQRDTFIGIRDGVIQHVGRTPPPDASWDTFPHATILPALMDAHVHLAYSGTLSSGVRTAQLAYGPAEAEGAVRRHVAEQWRHGVIAVRDGGDRLGANLCCSRGDDASLDPPVTVKACGHAWHAEGRYGRMIGRALPPEGADMLAARMATIDHLKVIQSGLNSIDHFGQSGSPQFSGEALRAMVAVAHRFDRPVMVHANGERPVRLAVEAGCDSIEHGYFMGEDNLRRMADRTVCWVPTVVPMAVLGEAVGFTPAQREVARRTVDHQMAQVQKAMAIGVTIALGTDAGSQGVDHGSAVYREMSLFQSAGMHIEQAVQSATSNVARLLQLDRSGELRPGCRADFLVVEAAADDLAEGLAGETSLWMGGRRYR